MGCQELERLEHILHQDYPLICDYPPSPLIHHRIGTACLECFLSKQIAVESFPFEGKKDGVLLTHPRVGGDGWMPEKNGIELGCLHLFRGCSGLIQRFSFLAMDSGIASRCNTMLRVL